MVLVLNPNIGHSYKFMKQANEEGTKRRRRCAAHKAQFAILWQK
jgi:hypothetical protein